MKRIVLLMLAIVLLVPMLGSCVQKDEPEYSEFGFKWMSPIQEHDGWVYYTDYPDGIFKRRADGSDKTFVNEKTPFWFKIYEGRIYFHVYKQNGTYDNSIYSCKTDGSDLNYFVIDDLIFI